MDPCVVEYKEADGLEFQVDGQTMSKTTKKQTFVD
jgi:hypothetical protein